MSRDGAFSCAQQTKNWCVGFSFPPPAYAGIHPTLYLFGFRANALNSHSPSLCLALTFLEFFPDCSGPSRASGGLRGPPGASRRFRGASGTSGKLRASHGFGNGFAFFGCRLGGLWGGSGGFRGSPGGSGGLRGPPGASGASGGSGLFLEVRFRVLFGLPALGRP